MEKKKPTHTGQTKVVGNRTSTHPVVPNYVDKIKNHVKESKLRNWKKVEKAFKRWIDIGGGSQCSYSNIQEQEIIKFFKKHFTK